MDDAEIDRILSKQDEILPSSGFVSSVMEAVRSEAAAPPPIPFPWKRAFPIFALAAAALLVSAGMLIAGIAQLSAASPAIPASATVISILSNIGRGGSLAGWTGLALLVALVSAKLSMRMAGGRS